MILLATNVIDTLIRYLAADLVTMIYAMTVLDKVKLTTTMHKLKTGILRCMQTEELQQVCLWLLDRKCKCSNLCIPINKVIQLWWIQASNHTLWAKHTQWANQANNTLVNQAKHTLWANQANNTLVNQAKHTLWSNQAKHTLWANQANNTLGSNCLISRVDNEFLSHLLKWQ